MAFYLPALVYLICFNSHAERHPDHNNEFFSCHYIHLHWLDIFYAVKALDVASKRDCISQKAGPGPGP